MQKIINVFTVGEHLVALTEDGKVYTAKVYAGFQGQWTLIKPPKEETKAE